MKINSAVLALFVGPGGYKREVFRNRALYWPHERKNWTERENRCLFIPTGLAQHFPAIFGRMRLKCPGSIGAEFGRNTKFIEQDLRFCATGNDQRVLDVALAHVFDERVHVPGFAAVADRQLVLRRCDAERANHHGGECIGELALEHGTFAGNYPVICTNFAKQERRENVRQVNLPRALKITPGEVKILRHDAEVYVLCTKHVPKLTERLLH